MKSHEALDGNNISNFLLTPELLKNYIVQDYLMLWISKAIQTQCLLFFKRPI